MKANRQIIFDKFHGKCAYCGCELQKGWHVDHINPKRRGDCDSRLIKSNIKRGTDDLENLNPSCARCNIRKNSLTLEQFRREIKEQTKRLKRDSNQFRLALDYGLIKETNIEVKFYFEQIEKLKSEGE